MLLLTSNYFFVPASEPQWALTPRIFASRIQISGLGRFLEKQFSNPEISKMILEILSIYALLQCTAVLTRLIERRHDVLHYVSQSEPN